MLPKPPQLYPLAACKALLQLKLYLFELSVTRKYAVTPTASVREADRSYMPHIWMLLTLMFYLTVWVFYWHGDASIALSRMPHFSLLAYPPTLGTNRPFWFSPHHASYKHQPALAALVS